MMGPKLFRLFSCLSFCFILGCATSKRLKEEEPKSKTNQDLTGSEDKKKGPSEREVLQVYLSTQTAATGALVWVKVTLPPSVKNTEVIGDFEGKKFTFFPESTPQVYGGIFGIPYERIAGSASLKVKAGEIETQVPFQIVLGKYRSEILRVGGRRVHPREKKDLVRIARDQALTAAIYRRDTLERLWGEHFELPVKSAITSPFGTKRLYNGTLKSYHTGVDLRAPLGTPIHTSGAGKVVLARDLFYTGNTVMVDHGYGIITTYAHLSFMSVKEGDSIPPQGLIGLSGQTGRVNGPHLHWQLSLHGVKVNPMDLVRVAQ